MREQESMEVKVKPTYKCHRTGLVFDTMKEVYQHRIENYPLDYVHGVPFQFLEVKLDAKEMASLPDDWDDYVEDEVDPRAEEEEDKEMTFFQMKAQNRETCSHPREMVVAYTDGAFCRACYAEVDL